MENNVLKKGEVILLRSNQNFEDRNPDLKNLSYFGPDGFYIKKKNITIDDIRGFQDELQKSSREKNLDFRKIGTIIFDDITISAQNSLLKILEDIHPENCIILWTNNNIKLLSTVMSRVVEIYENVEPTGKTKKPELPDLTDKENPIDKQQVIEWIKYTIENSKINKDKKPLIWINSPSPNIKYIIEYVNLFY